MGADPRLSTKAIAEALGVSDQTIRRWSGMGVLPPYEVHHAGRRGKTGLFPPHAIEQARWVLMKLENHASWDEIREALANGEFVPSTKGK